MKHLQQSHAQVITCGLGDNSFALSRLLAFCSNPFNGSLSYGWKLFQRIEHPTICICNTMIKAFLLNEEPIKTMEIYTHMLRVGMVPDNYTLPYVLKASANMRSCHLGELIHGHCLKLGFLADTFVSNSLIVMYSAFDDMNAARVVFDEVPWHSVVSWTVLISGYAKVGDVDSARLMFDEAPLKDRGIWSAMISGYVQNSCFKEGLHMFRLMQLTGIEPDEAVFTSILCACANLGSLETGIWIHRYLDRVKFPRTVKLGTALIDMYAKCGYLDLAEKVFDEMPQRDTVCWNAMISGWAMHGDGYRALQLFSEMEKAGIRPDDVTFIAIFSACSYSGMAYEGLRLFSRMCNVYNIEPKSEHYGCIIDFLGRTGLIEEAKEIIERMPNSTSPSEEAVVWRALMSAACSHGNIRLAEVAAEKLLKLERHSGAYVLLSNLYSTAGKHENVRQIRKMMKTRGIDKTPGCSSVEINGNGKEFIAGESTHPEMGNVHGILESMNRHLDCLECHLNLVST
ncbi:hypothetical protein Vadar_020906 [Vaccinium darrowii]|uniref:Uncharacterized protein n=1 Tax=Vaccinium darrowii TaxID=229202 RepID=A0ACB7YXM2_9ERIC|nr:hypothetical protein Vadar_020906 [Vaccinium darrowii]